MRLSVEFINRFTIIFVLFLGFDIYCFGDDTELHYCTTDDCNKTGIEFERAINWSVSAPCDDFYHYACGSRNDMLRQIFDSMKTQEIYLREWLDYYSWRTVITIQNLRSSDAPHVQSIKRYNQLCTDTKKLSEAGVKPIVSFLNTVPSYKSWWELENWAVSAGLSSTLFSVKIDRRWDRRNEQGLVILTQPHTTSFQHDYFNICRNMLKKLKEAGLNTRIMEKLSDGILKERALYSDIVFPVSSKHHQYGAMTLVSASNWHDLWDKKRKIPSGLTKNDWNNYFENYWNGSVTANGIVPLFKNAQFRIYIENSLLVETLGSALEQFSDDNMKNILLWRMVTQMVEYAGNDTRNALELIPKQKCVTTAMESALQKSYWYDIIPKSVRMPIKKMYSKVDLQAKLITYKELTKIRLDSEPLTPREEKNFQDLKRAVKDSDRIVKSLESELNLKKVHLNRMESYPYPYMCVDYELSHYCTDSYSIYYWYQEEIPKAKEQMKVLESELAAKRGEYNRSTTRLQDFQAVNGKRMSRGATHKKKAIMFQDYIKNRRHPKFPFVDTFTRPKLVIQTPAVDADYVQLGLNLKKWERAMLLQAPETFEPNIEDKKFIINGFTHDFFARFKNNRPSSLNYGALGSALGFQISCGLRVPVIVGAPFVYLDSYINKDLLMRKDLENSDWRHNLSSYINAHGYGVYDWVDMSALLSTFDQFLKENPVGTKRRNLNVTEWLLVGYEVANVGIGLKAAWNARQRDLGLNGEKDERLADVGKKDILSRFNQNMLFFHSFGYSNCRANYLHIRKTAINTLLKSYSKFNEVYRTESDQKSICIAPSYPPNI